MKDQKLSVDYIIEFILSFGCVGYLPKAPGTFGSLATIPFLFLFSTTTELLVASAVLTIFSIMITHYYQQKFSLHDPGWIVIDEVIGMLVTFSFLFLSNSGSLNLLSIILGFTYFRFFDIFKIPPATYFDRMHHGAGTILDDVISGVYAGLLLCLSINFIS